MTHGTAPDALAPDIASRLADFARACKAAARSVSLYPDGHPATVAALARLVDAAARATTSGPMAITVLPDALQVEGRVPRRPDPAIGELAALLHQHLVGEIRLMNAADAQAWRSFLLLLGRSTEELLAEGGIGRLWATTGGPHLQIREIDYAEVLKERTSGAEAAWEAIVANCLSGDAVDLDEETMRTLLDLADDVERLTELTRHIDEQAAGLGGARSQARALVRLLELMAKAALTSGDERLDTVLKNAAVAAGRLSPDVMLELLTERYQAAASGGMNVVGEVVDRMSDATIATFVASSVVTERGATARLAQAFQALVPQNERRGEVVGLAALEVAQTPMGRDTSFSELWQRASEMLLSYRDETFVSTEYARELSVARSLAVDVERTSDDPPERIAAWLTTVTDAELRALDLQLLLDLLRLEEDPGRWKGVVEPAVAHLDDLAQLGDFESAVPLAQALAREVAGGRAERAPVAAAALDKLATGHLMDHVVSHLRTVDDDVVAHVTALCHALGGSVIRPLAEALSVEERGRAFRRLTDLLVSFGSRGRDAVEQLKNSQNPAVRRTAIYLLRAFGGNDALPELAPLLDDADPNVQREAIRAIVTIGTDEAYGVLERALVSGSARSQDAMIGALGTLRDERAVPLFLHILKQGEYRRKLRTVYEAAIEALGAIGGADAVNGLRPVLHAGEWWAPWRTAALRSAAAAALFQIGTPDASAVLTEAAQSGARGVRTAARQQLERGGPLRRQPRPQDRS